MSHSHVTTAQGVLRNAAALLLVGVFAKGMGLIIVVLVARFLGTEATGLYALLFSVAMLIEATISIGMSESLVRDVAAHPRQAANLYFGALRLVLLLGLIPAAIAALVAVFGYPPGDTRSSLLVVGAGAPIAGAFLVSQAVLQGAERVLLLTWVTFVTRVISLVWLAAMLYQGAGVTAAFVSRLIFQGGMAIICVAVLWRGRSAEPAHFTSRALFTRSLPFALVRAIREFNTRLPSLVLPGAAGLAAAGVFDAANRVRSTLAMTMAGPVIGLMPAFARQFADPAAHTSQLVGFSLKYMCLAMAAVATVLGLAAHWIVLLLFGAEFAGALLPLQILLWAQVIVAMDAAQQQALLAARREYVVVANAATSLAVQFILVLALAAAYGLPGAAAAVALAAALQLGLNLRFLHRQVARVQLGRLVGAPVAVAAIVAAVMLALHDQPLLLRAAALAAAWTAGLLLFRVLPREELRFIKAVLPLPRALRGRPT